MLYKDGRNFEIIIKLHVKATGITPNGDIIPDFRDVINNYGNKEIIVDNIENVYAYCSHCNKKIDIEIRDNRVIIDEEEFIVDSSDRILCKICYDKYFNVINFDEEEEEDYE